VLLLETRPSFDDGLLVSLVEDADGSYRAALAPARWSFHRHAEFALGPTPVPSQVAEPAFALHPCPVPYHENLSVVDGISYTLRIEDAAAVATCELINPHADEPDAAVVRALLDLAARLAHEHGDEAARELVAVWRSYESQLTADEREAARRQRAGARRSVRRRGPASAPAGPRTRELVESPPPLHCGTTEFDHGSGSTAGPRC